MTREPEFDDLERDKLLALGQYEAGLCDCGIHKSISHDKTHVFTLEAEWCPLCQALAVQKRELDNLDSDAFERAGNDRVKRLPSDGRRTYLRELTTTEIEERRSALTAAKEVRGGSSRRSRPA